MKIVAFLLTLSLLGSASQAVALRKLNLPPAVRQAIRAEATPQEVEDVNFTVDEGRQVYEVDILHNGVERSIEVGEDGTLLTRQVFLQELSAPVQQMVGQLKRFGQVGDIYWVDDDGEISYAVEVTQMGTKGYFTIALDGRLMATPIKLAELPPAVQKTIQAQVANGTIFTIDRVDDYGEISVEVAMLKNGRRRVFDVDPQGSLVEQQAYLDELPAAAQETIKQNAGSSRLAHIDMTVEGGQNFFEARIVTNGAARTVTVGADGKVTSQQIDLAEAPEPVKKTLQEKARGGQLLKLEKVFDDNATSYDVDIAVANKRVSFTILEDGKMGGADSK